MIPQVKVAITLDDGSLSIMSFLTEGRSPTLPYGAVWSNEAAGLWTREPTDANLFAEITKTFLNANAQPARYTVVKAEDIPTDRSQRALWQHDGTTFSIKADV